MTPVETLEALRSAGFSVDVQDGRLIIDGHGMKPSDELREAVAEHAQRIVAMLLIPRRQPEPPGGRLLWQARDHVCSTACMRDHAVCNACGQALRPSEQHWPWLHGACRLKLAEGEP